MKIVRCWFFAAILIALCLVAPGVARSDERPNVLFFMTDDESWLERSAYGWSKLPTPHFDRVARDGVLFTNAFASAPSCAPSRASVLTGRHFWELKQGAFIQAWLPREFPVFPKLLAESGYHVGRTGKGWGPGVHPDIGHGADVAGEAVSDKTLQDRPAGISSQDYAANFEAFLKTRPSGQPFFFWAGTTEPHGPWDEDNHQRLEREFGVTLRDVKVPRMLEDTPQVRRERANFLYEICYADRHLGRMLARLEAIGELDKTLVFVTSDNGTAVEQGKSTPYEWGTHEPLAIMWPARIPAGRTVTDFVNFADFAPTILEAAGAKVPASMSGRSFLPVLTSEKSGRVDPSRNFTVTGLEWHGEFDPESKSSRTIRDDRFAYIVRYDNVDAAGNLLDTKQASTPASVELYDLAGDPWQQRNLADDPAFADEVRRYAEQLREFGRTTGDPRVTGEMEIFKQTRQFVQHRKRVGYGKTRHLPE